MCACLSLPESHSSTVTCSISNVVIVIDSGAKCTGSGQHIFSVRTESSVSLFDYRTFSIAKQVNTGMQMRGLAVGRSCFVAWSGKVARLYRVDVQLQRYDALEAVHTTGSAMAIADASHIIDETWFVAEGSVVKILNFGGTVRGTITFSEGEGVPTYLDLNGQYLAIVTNKGFIKVVDVHAPTKPKMLGSAGQFFATKAATTSAGAGSGKRGAAAAAVVEDGANASNGAPSADNTRIRTIRVNSSGTMVALLTG